MSNEPRRGMLVVGIGNQLRCDDGVGIYLLRRLSQAFGDKLRCEEAYELDITLAEQFAEHDHVVILDATLDSGPEPFTRMVLQPADSWRYVGGFISHVVDWGIILALCRDLYGAAPLTELVAVRASDFDFGEGMSQCCAANADAAFRFLLGYCRQHP